MKRDTALIRNLFLVLIVMAGVAAVGRSQLNCSGGPLNCPGTPTGTGVVVLQTSPTLVTPLLGTPTSGVLTNATGYPVASLANLGTGIATFLTTASSANLLSALTTSSGTGSAVFSNAPALTTPTLTSPIMTNPAVTGSDNTTFLVLTGPTTGYTYMDVKNTGGRFWFGNESSSAGSLLTGTLGYATVLSTTTTRALQFGTNLIVGMTMDPNNQNVMVGTSTAPTGSNRLAVKGAVFSGGTPTIGTCGTGSVTSGSTDVGGEATSNGATTCTVNFSASFGAAPFCTANDETRVAALQPTTAVGSVTVAGLTSGDKFFWHCIGRG